MKFLTRGRIVGVGLLALMFVLASCGSSSGNAASPGKASNTITWAERPGDTPDWIWSYMPAAKESNMNLQVQYMLYRPLYFFGGDGTATVTQSISLAQQPSYSADGKTLTITLKNYKWSNGEQVTAQDVMFFINMYKAEPANFYDYTPGLFPDNIVSAKAENATTLSITTDKAYSQKWFLYNQLSQITPMPDAWDVTGPGQKSDCDTNESDCAAVYAYLNAQSASISTYDASSIWSIVDGPWKLKSYNSDGNVSFVPNAAYSGPVKAQVKQFNMASFTTESAEFNVLRSGKTLDVGYIPTADISTPRPANTSPGTAGPNPVSNYTMKPWYLYGFQYTQINFNNPTIGPIFKQLYFRQALQSLVNQPAIIKAAAKNYGLETTGPIPLYPQNSDISKTEANNPYPFSISKAKELLTQNGWDVKPGGTTTCAKAGTGAGECGAGVTQGQPLQFQLGYATGQQTLATGVQALKSDGSQVGIQISVRAEPFDTLITNSAPCSGSSCTWQMSYWGGWSYGPDFYPTGESLFSTGSGSNFGSYSDPKMDSLINTTLTNSSTSALVAYENYAATQLPAIWQPAFTFQLTEIGGGLHGANVQNPFNWLTPETWHY